MSFILYPCVLCGGGGGQWAGHTVWYFTFHFYINPCKHQFIHSTTYPISCKVPDTLNALYYWCFSILEKCFFRCVPGGEGRASHWLEHELSLILWSTKLPKLVQKLPACSKKGFFSLPNVVKTSCSTAVTGAPSSRSSSSPLTSSSWFSETCNSLTAQSMMKDRLLINRMVG